MMHMSMILKWAQMHLANVLGMMLLAGLSEETESRVPEVRVLNNLTSIILLLPSFYILH